MDLSKVSEDITKVLVTEEQIATRVAELAAELGVTALWLSISDEQAYACATVILEA